jgi:type II secretory pathway component PulJ
MRKGYTLMETMVVVFITMVLMTPICRLFRVILYELPKDSRLVQENIVLLDAVRHIRCDVASAIAVSQEADDTSGTTLIIQQSAGVIYYEFGDGRIVRRKTDAIPEDIVWSLPHGKVETRIRDAEQTGYAVELVTFIEDRDLGHARKKMANNYLCFTGMPWEAGK